jgi:acyl-CoA synthetase (AMP-forming)/AMP-acid ligase II
VEAALLAHPAVEEACVFGLPDPEWGQRVAAAVVLRENVAPESLREHLTGRLAAFKHPRSLFPWPDLPRTASGKVARRRVVERALLESAAAGTRHGPRDSSET